MNKTAIEIEIPFIDKPVIHEVCGRWVVSGEIKQPPTYTRAAYVRTYNPDESFKPIDWKGFLVGPTRKLTKG